MLNIGEFARLGQVSTRTLRHYDELGLLAPARTDVATGYRFYSVRQLAELHRVLALRDLGFTLEQIGKVLGDDPSIEELRGMLRLRRAQIELVVGDELARLRRVEAHLRALEGSESVVVQDVVMKKTQPIRMAEIAAPGLTHQDIGPAFERLLPEVLAHITGAGATPGISVGWYEDETVDGGGIVLHAGFEIAGQDVPDSDRVHVVDLPVVDAASVIHRGHPHGIPAAWEAFMRWIEDSGYRLAGPCRELYHEFHLEDLSANVTELQQAVSRP
jgi:DNA-binding transcriptional MerR regulator